MKRTSRIQAALDRIGGTVEGNQVIYYDDPTQKFYLAPLEDLSDLADLMEDDDEDVARDAYSHWCAGTSHPECDEEGLEK